MNRRGHEDQALVASDKHWLLNQMCGFILFLLLINAVGCAPVPPKVIEISKNQSFRPSTPDDVKNIDQAIATVITAATGQVGLPPVDHLKLWLYQNTESFTYWGGWRNPMAHVADATAFTGGRSIHVNLEKLIGRQWDEQVGVLAHEYGHAVQSALGSHDRAAVVCWFNEGFAEWVRIRVLDSLKWQNTELASQRTQRELSFHQGVQLSLLEDCSNWDLYRRRPGGFVKTYVIAFVAVDQLIKVKGLPAAIDYLKTGRFEHSFGQSQRDFGARLKQSAREIPANDSVQLVVPRPEWEVGYSWTYEEKPSVWKPTSLKVEEIVGTDSISNVPVFLVREGTELTLRSAETLGVLETRRDGVVNTRRNKPNQNLDWPLQPAKEWRNIYAVENIKTKRTYNIDRVMAVSEIETVKVPAGAFKAIKIEGYDYQTGILQLEYWYSPQVKWFVKTIDYDSMNTNISEKQLVSFKLDK